MNLKLIATAALLVVACQSYAESYTYYQNENGTVTVQRDEGLYSAEPSVVSSCIALPVSWSDNVEATINGTASATHFSAALNIDTDNAALMNSNWSYPGFNWSCFSDIARSYERGEKVLVSFTLKPGVADMLAFTTLGFYESEYLFQEILPHTVSCRTHTWATTGCQYPMNWIGGNTVLITR